MTNTMRHPMTAAMALFSEMDALLPSPCQQHGVSPDGSAFPCLKHGWGDRPCPMNAALRGWMKTREAQMYALGYPYAAWVVKKRLFGISSGCSLQFTREAPTKENAKELFGNRVLWMARANLDKSAFHARRGRLRYSTRAFSFVDWWRLLR
jgi:hypothetical protein